MEVILNQDLEKIGKAGQVVKVKDGFARNFLIPKGLAIPKTSAGLKKLEQAKTAKILAAEKIKKAAEELRDKLAGLSLTLPVLTQEDESMYANIAAADICAALKEEGFQIDKNMLILDEPIRSLGIYEVAVKLHPEVTGKIKIWIVKK